MNYLILIDKKETKAELDVAPDKRLNFLRLMLMRDSLIAKDDVFLREGKDVTAAEEAEKTVEWLTGGKQPPAIALRKAGSASPKPDPKGQDGGEKKKVKVAIGDAAAKDVEIPADTGATVKDLRAALVAAGAITEGNNFLGKDRTALPRRDEAAVKWADLVADGRIALAAADTKPTIGTVTPQSRTTTSLDTQTRTQTGKPGPDFQLGPGQTQTSLDFELTADKLGKIAETPVRTLEAKTVEKRLEWLRARNFFKAMRMTASEVKLTTRDVFRVVPDTLEPEYAIPALKTVYRNTKAATRLERDVAKLCENGGGGSVEAGFGGFSGQLSASGGRAKRDRTMEGEATLYVSTSVLVTSLQASFALENLMLTDWARDKVSTCVAQLGGTVTTAASDVQHVLQLFEQVGAFFAATAMFGGKLSIEESITRKTHEEAHQDALKVEAAAQAKYSSFFTVAAKGNYAHSNETFDATLRTSENLSYAIVQYGGREGSLADPGAWCGSLADVDNQARILDLDVLPVPALLPAAEQHAIMGALTRGQNTKAFQESPINLASMVGWYQSQFLGGLE